MKKIILISFFLFPLIYSQSQEEGNFYGDCPEYTNEYTTCRHHGFRDCIICCYHKHKCYYRDRIISERDFRELVEFIKEKWFESEKTDYLKEIINYHYFSSYQAKKLLELLWFESDRLEIAMHIYLRIADKGNFYKVYGAFLFSSSVDELRQYIYISNKR